MIMKLTIDLLIPKSLMVKIWQTFTYQIIDRGLRLSLLNLLVRSKWLVLLADVLLNRLFPIEIQSMWLFWTDCFTVGHETTIDELVVLLLLVLLLLMDCLCYIIREDWVVLWLRGCCTVLILLEGTLLECRVWDIVSLISEPWINILLFLLGSSNLIEDICINMLWLSLQMLRLWDLLLSSNLSLVSITVHILRYLRLIWVLLILFVVFFHLRYSSRNF